MNERTYECVIRRRHRMGTEIAACGTMSWDAESRFFVFNWTVSEDFQPNPVLVVEIDIYDGDELVGLSRTMQWLHSGQTYPIAFREDDGDDEDDLQRDDPEPPGIALDFDPDELLRKPVRVLAPVPA